jgi:hypothetical protein
VTNAATTTASPPWAPTATQRESYFRDGIVYPIPVLTPEEVRRLRAECDGLEARLGGRPRTVEVRQMHLHFRWAYDLVTHPRVIDAVADLLGPDVLVWASELFAKHPFEPAVSIGWHRDRPYMGFAPESTVTAWIALSESTVENGCVKAIPGPDRGSVGLDEGRAVNVVLRPGEMSLHDAEILHGSPPNRSATKRVGFAVRYVTPDAQPPGGRPPAVVARGRATSKSFEIVAPPGERPADEALSDMRRSAMMHLEAMLANLERKDD